MGTSNARISLQTTLFPLLCLSYAYLSTALDIYSPVEHFTIMCGSSTTITTNDGRNWNGDTNVLKYLSEDHDSVGLPSPPSPSIQEPYTSARLSHSPFTYSFPVTPGPKFLRLFFNSASYPNFNRSAASFSVQSANFTLLEHFNASLNADADDNPEGTFSREFCINVKEGEGRLSITFIPTTSSSYAFINAIEVVSMPPYLYYTSPNNTGMFPQLVGPNTQYSILNDKVLENMYRLKAGGAEITASNDSGMFRDWDSDETFVTSQSVALTVDYGHEIKNLTFSKDTPEYSAPDEVYRTLRNMGPDPSENERFNLTWQFPVDAGFTYMLRLHFCQLDPQVEQTGDLRFLIFVADQLVTDWGDILSWTQKRGVIVVRDYVVLNAGNQKNQKRVNISLKLHPHPDSLIQDATLNAIELFKISNSTGSLAGPNPDPRPQLLPTQSSHRNKSRGTNLAPIIVAVVASGVVLLSFLVVFHLFKRRTSADKSTSKHSKDKTSRGSGSSSLPTNLCRHFSFAEIKAATNNFDQLFVVGVGGFGHVYKGYIDDGSTRVAIKRLKPGSQQGANEFMNEIEMLSQLRHLHLVSLIGYCYEHNEMILVYDFMDRGTLSEHLYATENPSLSWKQRLEICLGAARGLHHLHTGAKHMIIHRDVKSTNILLDEKWVAKVSDFGLSRFGPIGTSITHVSTQVKGSVGYLDPEYYKRQRLTEKSDVYSFGVVLLEVLCGRQPLLRTVEKQQVSLVDWAKRCFHLGSVGKIVDPAMKGRISPEYLRKFCELALSCLLEDGSQRPSMKDVVGVLEFVLQLEDYSGGAHGVVVVEEESGENYLEDSADDMFSSSSSRHVSEYSKSTGFSTTTDGSKESDRLMMSMNVFSEIKDPKGR